MRKLRLFIVTLFLILCSVSALWYDYDYERRINITAIETETLVKPKTTIDLSSYVSDMNSAPSANCSDIRVINGSCTSTSNELVNYQTSVCNSSMVKIFLNTSLNEGTNEYCVYTKYVAAPAFNISSVSSNTTHVTRFENSDGDTFTVGTQKNGQGFSTSDVTFGGVDVTGVKTSLPRLWNIAGSMVRYGARILNYANNSVAEGYTFTVEGDDSDITPSVTFKGVDVVGNVEFGNNSIYDGNEFDIAGSEVDVVPSTSQVKFLGIDKTTSDYLGDHQESGSGWRSGQRWFSVSFVAQTTTPTIMAMAVYHYIASNEQNISICGVNGTDYPDCTDFICSLAESDEYAKDSEAWLNVSMTGCTLSVGTRYAIVLKGTNSTGTAKYGMLNPSTNSTTGTSFMYYTGNDYPLVTNWNLLNFDKEWKYRIYWDVTTETTNPYVYDKTSGTQASFTGTIADGNFQNSDTSNLSISKTVANEMLLKVGGSKWAGLHINKSTTYHSENPIIYNLDGTSATYSGSIADGATEAGTGNLSITKDTTNNMLFEVGGSEKAGLYFNYNWTIDDGVNATPTYSNLTIEPGSNSFRFDIEGSDKASAWFDFDLNEIATVHQETQALNYSDIAIETGYSRFNITFDHQDVSDVNVTLYWNGTYYTPDKTNETHSLLFNATADVPLYWVNNSDTLWHWNYSLEYGNGTIITGNAPSSNKVQKIHHGFWWDSLIFDPIQSLGGDVFTALGKFHVFSAEPEFTATATYNGTTKTPTNNYTSSTQKWYTTTFTNPLTYIEGQTINGYATMNLTFLDSTRAVNSSSATMSLYSPGLFVCNSTRNATAINFTAVDEEIRTNAINVTDWQAVYNLTSQNSSRIWTHNFTYTDKSSAAFCLYPSWSTINVTGQVLYQEPAEYKARFRYLTSAAISNTTSNNTVYLLNSTHAATATITVTIENKNNMVVPGVLVRFMRYIIGENAYITVAECKTGSAGTCQVSIRQDDYTHYKVVLIQDSAIVKTYGGPHQIIGTAVTYHTAEPEEADYWETYGIYDYACNTTNSTGDIVISCAVISTSGTDVTATLDVQKLYHIGNKTICSNQQGSVGSAIVCTITNAVGVYHYSLYITLDNSDQLLTSGILDYYSRQRYNTEGIVMAFIISTALVFVSKSPATAIMLSLIGIAVSWGLQLINVEWGAIISLVTIGLVFLFKLK